MKTNKLGRPRRKDRSVRSPEGRPGRKDRPVRSPEGCPGREDGPVRSPVRPPRTKSRESSDIYLLIYLSYGMDPLRPVEAKRPSHIHLRLVRSGLHGRAGLRIITSGWSVLARRGERPSYNHLQLWPGTLARYELPGHAGPESAYSGFLQSPFSRSFRPPSLHFPVSKLHFLAPRLRFLGVIDFGMD